MIFKKLHLTNIYNFLLPVLFNFSAFVSYFYIISTAKMSARDSHET